MTAVLIWHVRLCSSCPWNVPWVAWLLREPRANDQGGTNAIRLVDVSHVSENFLGVDTATAPALCRLCLKDLKELIDTCHGLIFAEKWWDAATHAEAAQSTNFLLKVVFRRILFWHISLSRKPDTARPSLSEHGIVVACNMKFRRHTAQIPKISKDLVSRLFRRRKRAPENSLDTFSAIQDLTKKKRWSAKQGQAC